jgi:hypothetical protein
MATPNPVNRDKGSSHPLRPGQFYNGEVTYVDTSGRVKVEVKTLGFKTPSLVMPIGATTLNKLKKGDLVACTFSDEFFTELVVFGSSKIKTDVFADKTVVDSLVATVTSLQNQIVVLNQRVTALENA